MLEMFWGAMRIGAIPCRSTTDSRRDEVKYVLEDSGAELLLFDDQATEIVDQIHDDQVMPDEILFRGLDPQIRGRLRRVRDGASDESVEIVSSRTDQAMLMYTSGTTGKPKGCILTHDNIIQMTVNGIVEKAFEGRNVHVDGRGIIVTPLFHISAFGMFINNYYASATTVLMNGFDPDRVMEVLESESVTNGFFVPMMARALLAVDDFEEYDLSAFEEFGIGAAPSGKELKQTDDIESVRCRVTGGVRSDRDVTGRVAAPAESGPRSSDSVGRPVMNVMFKIIDPDTHEEVEPGEIGQACYRGPTMFSGYYQMPERTEEAFDDDGFFISGDLIRQDEEGFIEFVGRSDNMIISGGKRLPGRDRGDTARASGHRRGRYHRRAGREMGRTNQSCGRSVDDEEPSAEELQDYVGERLADYKKPREFIFLKSLPRNPTGKVLKSSLADEDGVMVGWES